MELTKLGKRTGKIWESAPILLLSTLSLSVGIMFVSLTSPTMSVVASLHITQLINQPTLMKIITIHALITDLTFVFLIAFLLLCNNTGTAKWIARNQSFPYSYTPSWNTGPESLDFQLLIFEIFHTGWTSRTIHMVGIVLEEGLWAMVVYLTFGEWGLLALVMALGLQSIGYRSACITFGAGISNTAVFGISWWVVQQMLIETWKLNTTTVLGLVKGALFWTVTIRTLSHVLEPLPPTYRPEVHCFDDNFGVIGWKLCLSNPFMALWLFILGNVSEFGAGMPGRLFNVVVYKCMYKVGFRDGTGRLDVKEAKDQAWKVIECGWMAHPKTAEMYQWASSRSLHPVYEKVDEKV